MAASAADRQPQHSLADRRDHIIQMIVADQFARLGGGLTGEGAGDKESGRRRSEKITRLEQVAGYLPACELIVGHILVERLDDEIAIVESVRSILVELVAGAVGKTNYVEPVSCPAFAVALA